MSERSEFRTVPLRPCLPAMLGSLYDSIDQEHQPASWAEAQCSSAAAQTDVHVIPLAEYQTALHNHVGVKKIAGI